MKLPKSIPLPLFIGVVIFFALLYGSYVAGSSNAPSSQPVYITDATGGNLADVVSVNKQGHLSVHIADSALPALAGAVYNRHVAFPVRPGLNPGQCYAAYFRGAGQFVTAAVQFRPGGAGRPQVLVRLDPDPVWVENGSPDSTPSGPDTGFLKSGNTYEFGYALPLTFKAFAGVMLCWHGSGRSDGFAVQITAANGGNINPYRPEEMLFQRSGDTFSWTKLQGPKPVAYQLMGTTSTLVSYYKNFGTAKPSPIPHVHHVGKPVIFVPHVRHFTETIPSLKQSYPRWYVFEVQAAGDPTRVGPFGSFNGE